MDRKLWVFVAMISGTALLIGAMASQPTSGKNEIVNKVVPVGCGKCIFKMKGEKDCRLAVKVGDRAYTIEGADIDGHGDAHAPDGLCSVQRLARVSGTIAGDHFVPASFQMLPANQSRSMTSAEAKGKFGERKMSKSGYDITPLSEERINELAKGLTPEERSILLDKDTERAFCGGLLDNKEEGIYSCRLCGLPLFASQAKFTSGTGWPSFFQPFDPDHIKTERDLSMGIARDEILCARCGSHLGHVFPDGPPPTHLRYCVNSASLTFAKDDGAAKPDVAATESAYFAGGCFWGVEDRFQQVPGVIDVMSGYMGGVTEHPTYQDVCSGTTGHAETVRVVYDPKKVSYRDLLERFFEFHDPTQLNRQGPDHGSQYRSAIFAANDKQLKIAKAFVAEKAASDQFKDKKIATQVELQTNFYEAEEYHQNYHAKHGGSCAIH